MQSINLAEPSFAVGALLRSVLIDWIAYQMILQAIQFNSIVNKDRKKKKKQIEMYELKRAIENHSKSERNFPYRNRRRKMHIIDAHKE